MKSRNTLIKSAFLIICILIFLPITCFAGKLYYNLQSYTVTPKKENIDKTKEVTEYKPIKEEKKPVVKTNKTDINKTDYSEPVNHNEPEIEIQRNVILPEFDERRNINIDITKNVSTVKKPAEPVIVKPNPPEVKNISQPKNGKKVTLVKDLPKNDNNLSNLIVSKFKTQIAREKQKKTIYNIVFYLLTFIFLAIILKIWLKPFLQFVKKNLNKFKRRRKRIGHLRRTENNDIEITGDSDMIEELAHWKKTGESSVINLEKKSTENVLKKADTKNEDYKGELGFHEMIEQKVDNYKKDHPETISDDEGEEDIVDEVVKLSNMGYNVTHISKKTGLTPGEVEMVIDIHKDRINREDKKIINQGL